MIKTDTEKLTVEMEGNLADYMMDFVLIVEGIKEEVGREIADVLLAVNRAYGKSDYIPCICWGRNARYAGNLTVGSRIQLRGRIQSREYQKRIGEGKVVDKIAYEVSASQMEYIEEEE
jgi:single-stranded DNA-binding protein